MLRAFTLTELLVVIGIIVLLIGILLPVMSRAMKAANRTRIASDLNAIATAISAYKSQNNDIPRIVYNTGTTQYNGIGSGAAVLGKALLGLGDSTSAPYTSGNTYLSGQIVSASANGGTFDFQALQNVPASNAPSEGSAYWAPIPLASAADGADGPGFRLRAGSGGQVYGPYLQPDKFKTRGLAILDIYGNPILYYPANPAKPVVTVDASGTGSFGAGNSYIGTAPGIATPNSTPVAPTAPCQSYYNYSDNDTVSLNIGNSNSTTDFTPAFSGLNEMAAMLGDYNMKGFIAPGETAATTADYILWSAGPDGVFGPVNFQASTDTTVVKKEVGNCDDVTNFVR